MPQVEMKELLSRFDMVFARMEHACDAQAKAMIEIADLKVENYKLGMSLYNLLNEETNTKTNRDLAHAALSEWMSNGME